MKKISLTQDKFALVDDIDYGFLMQWKWCLDSHGYAKRNSRKSDGFDKRITIRMHQIVLIRKLGHSNFKEADHKNQNKLDNQRNNLRPASNSQNRRNRKSYKGSLSKFKGVCWHKCNKKWSVEIGFEGRRKHLGYFTDEVEAAKAYNRAATKYFKEFAHLNSI